MISDPLWHAACYDSIKRAWDDGHQISDHHKGFAPAALTMQQADPYDYS